MEDAEILCKTLQFEFKLFYFDLKENSRGRYLKISEKTSAKRSTIIVPVNGIAWFLDLFDYYVNADDRDMFSKELKLDAKVFYFDVGENKRGRFLKVSEASVSRNRSTIVIPAGSSSEEGWAAFRNILLEVNDEASCLFNMPNQNFQMMWELDLYQALMTNHMTKWQTRVCPKLSEQIIRGSSLIWETTIGAISLGYQRLREQIAHQSFYPYLV